MRFVANFLMLAALIPAAEPSRQQVLEERRARFGPLVRIEELAQAVPPELGAYAELRLAESPKLSDKRYRLELVEDAFHKASHGSRKVPVKAVAMPGMEGTQAAVTAQAAKLGLDALSLQSRAVSDLAAIDPRRARMFFEMIIVPAPAKMSCQDALVEDYSVYYAAAERVAQQLKGDDAMRFVNDLLSRIGSASQLAGAVRFLTTQRMAAFGAALQRVEGDDRSFTASLQEVKAAMNAMAPGNPVLIAAYRQYLVRNLHATRCAESLDLDWNVENARQAVAEFQRYAGDMAIPEDDVKAEGKGESAKTERILDPQFASAQRAKFQALMFGSANRALGPQMKSGSDWQQSFGETLSEVSGMKPAPGQSEAVFFYAKGGSLQALLLAAPAGPERDRVLAQYLEFLQNSNFQNDHPAEWFAPVESLLGMARSMEPQERAKLLESMERSAHPTLALFAALEQHLETRPDWAR